jgi:hypothetical protein
VTLTDKSVNGFNELYQAFNLGTALTFDVTLSDNPTAQVPDELAIAILDNTGGQIVNAGWPYRLRPGAIWPLARANAT